MAPLGIRGSVRVKKVRKGEPVRRKPVRKKRVAAGSKPVGRPEVKILTGVQQEQIVLAAMMRDTTILRDLATTLESDTFLAKRHREMFRILRRMAVGGLSYSVESFEAESKGVDFGGREYLMGIDEAYPSPLVNLENHLSRVKLSALKHHLRIGDGQRLMDMLANPHSKMEEIHAKGQEILKGLEGHGVDNLLVGEKLRQRYLADFYGRMDKSVYVPTGYPELDENLTEGFAPKRLSIVTARPSIGKSTFAWNLAMRAFFLGIPVVYFALEMSAEAVMDGMVSAATQVPLDDLIKFPHELGQEAIFSVEDCIRKLTESNNFAIWDRSMTLEKAARIIREGGFKLAFWDLWEKIVPEKVQDVIAKLLDRTQQMAKDTDCHQCLIHQTGRRVEGRANKRPTLTDLKNSGGYEECADLVLGLYRESYYNENVDKDVLEVGILKQRRGSRMGWYGFEFDGAHGRVGEAVADWSPNFG